MSVIMRHAAYTERRSVSAHASDRSERATCRSDFRREPAADSGRRRDSSASVAVSVKQSNSVTGPEMVFSK